MKSKILDDEKLISFIRDISDRKLGTEMLEKSELTYRSLINEVIDSSSVAIFILDSEFKVVWINKSTEKFFGVTKSETKGKVKADLIRNTISKIFENPQEFEEKVISTYKNNTYTESFECHVLPKGKRKERWLFHWSQPISSGMYKGGRIEHYTDITEQKIVKTELEKSKAELESIYRFSPAMTCILDDKRNVLYANKAFTNFTGTTEEELKLGKACGVIGCINSFDDARGCGFGNGCADCKLRLALDETLKTGKTLLNIEYNPIVLKDGIKKQVYFIGSSALLKFGENRQLILTLHDITEQKEFEETLKKFENIVASTKDAVSLLDKNYKYLIVNKSYEKFSGQKKEQIIGKSVEDFLGKKAFNEKVKPNFDKCLNGETISYQDYFEYPTLGKRFVEVTYFPYRNSLDEIDGIIANTKDITEKKIIEESLKESENRFKNMANTAPVLIWMSDENKLCNYFNDVWLNFTGRTMEQELGNGWAEGVHKEDLDYCLEIYNKNFDARKEFKMEYRLKHYDGSYKWIFDHGVPRFSENGNFIGYIGSGIDIQDKKEKEDALKIQSEILQNMAEGSSLVRVSDGTIVFANPSFEKMFGYEKGELLGKHISNLNAPTDQSPEEIANEIIEDLTKNKIWKGEVKNIRKDGSIFWSYATVSTFNHNLYGEVWATAQSDVTAKKNLEAIQIKEKKRLEILHDLYSKAKSMSDNEMYNFVIEKAVELTDSRIGFFHEISGDQKTIKLTAWSSETIKECTAVVNDHYPINQAGNWIESIKQKKPLIYNNFITSPNQKGLPEGHSIINRMMSVPVMHENKVKYIFGVGNKETNYDENDTLQVQLVADELQKILATRKANEEILKSNERLKEAERIGNIGYFYFEVPDGKVIWSDEVFRIIERDIKLGVPTIEEYNKYIDPEYLKNFNAEIEEILSKKTSFDFIYKINAPSKDKFIQSIGKVHLNEKGEVCALSGVIKDITDYQLALLSSKENEEKFETAFKTSPDAIAISRIKDGTYIDINNSFKRILGYDREEMIGKSSIKLNIWRYEKDRQRLLKALKENGYVENLDAEYLTKNGEIIYGLMSARLIKFGGEDVILSITRDITQRTNIARALKESEIKHRKLISKISDVIAVINSERKITYKSSNIEEYFGWKPEELIGKEALFTCHPKDYDRIDNELIKLIQNRNYQVRLEFDYRCKDGSYKPIELTAINLTEDPIIKGVVVNYKDISERKKAEKIVVETQRLGAIGEMSSAIAHDFNNSLQSIFGNLELALLNLDKNHASRRFLETIKVATSDAATRVKLLQRFAGTSKMRDEYSAVDINEMIRDVILQSRPIWKDNPEKDGIKILVHEELKSIKKVLGNEGELRSVLYNIIKNSVEAMPGGGEIIIRTSDNDEKVTIKIQDSGKGMDEDIKSRIFQPFFTTKGFESGRGLGMSGAYSIIKEHSGNIFILQSSPNTGTTIAIELPHYFESKKEAVIEDSSNITESKKAKILWVDDEEMIREIAEEILQLIDYSGSVVANGYEAMEMLSKERFDLVVTDIGMSGMSGWDLADKINSKFDNKIKIAVLTGWGDQISEEKMRKHGVSHVIAKPFRIEQIKNLFNEMLK